MGAMIELAVAALLGAGALFGTVAFIGQKLPRLIESTDWAVRRRQAANRKRIEAHSGFRCTEHKRVYAREELVQGHSGALYCPDCYKEHVFAESADSKVVTDLGVIHKELGLTKLRSVK